MSPLPGKGNGLVITEDVKQGTLLMVSKAAVRTCIRPGSEEGRRIGKLLSMDFNTRYVEKTSYYQHAVDAMHTVMRNPQLTQKFYSLWAGEEWVRDEETLDGISPGAVDVWRVERIIAMNSFRTNQVESAIDLTNSGLWLLPSAINHACLREFWGLRVEF